MLKPGAFKKTGAVEYLQARVSEHAARGLGAGSMISVKRLLQGATAREAALFDNDVRMLHLVTGDCKYILNAKNLIDLEEPMDFKIIQAQIKFEHVVADLHHYLRSTSSDLPSCLRMGHDVSRALEHLKSRGIVHARVSARSCYITISRLVKLGDFTHSFLVNRDDCFLTHHEHQQEQTQRHEDWYVGWEAIEVLIDNKRHSFHSDVWSFATLLWEIFSQGQPPFAGLSLSQIKQRVLNGVVLDRPKAAPPYVHGLMTECWSPRADARRPIEHVVLELQSMLSNPEINSKESLQSVVDDVLDNMMAEHLFLQPEMLQLEINDDDVDDHEGNGDADDNDNDDCNAGHCDVFYQEDPMSLEKLDSCELLLQKQSLEFECSPFERSSLPFSNNSRVELRPPWLTTAQSSQQSSRWGVSSSVFIKPATLPTSIPLNGFEQHQQQQQQTNLSLSSPSSSLGHRIKASTLSTSATAASMTASRHYQVERDERLPPSPTHPFMRPRSLPWSQQRDQLPLGQQQQLLQQHQHRQDYNDSSDSPTPVEIMPRAVRHSWIPSAHQHDTDNDIHLQQRRHRQQQQQHQQQLRFNIPSACESPPSTHSFPLTSSLPSTQIYFSRSSTDPYFTEQQAGRTSHTDTDDHVEAHRVTSDTVAKVALMSPSTDSQSQSQDGVTVFLRPRDRMSRMPSSPIARVSPLRRKSGIDHVGDTPPDRKSTTM